MSISEFEQINKTTYSTAKAIEIYSVDYVWPYEKYLAEHYVKPGDRVLDLGCGTGRSTVYIAGLAKEVIGIDMSVPFIEQGKKMHPGLDLRVMNAAELAFPNASFDVVFFSNQGIDYADKRTEILAESYRVLKPGGIFAYSSHNSLTLPRSRKGWKNLWANIRLWRPGYHVRVEHHANGDLYVAHTNIWSESRRLHKVGFTVIDILTNIYPRSHLPKWITGFCTRWPLYVCRKNLISHK